MNKDATKALNKLASGSQLKSARQVIASSGPTASHGDAVSEYTDTTPSHLARKHTRVNTNHHINVPGATASSKLET